MDFDYKMAIITRKDLKLSTGKLAAQVAHAAVECALMTKKNNSKWFNKWMNEGAKKAILKTDSIDDFYSLKENADSMKISSVVISDAGHTELPAGTITVLGVGPGPNNLIDKITGHLSLL